MRARRHIENAIKYNTQSEKIGYEPFCVCVYYKRPTTRRIVARQTKKKKFFFLLCVTTHAAEKGGVMTIGKMKIFRERGTV